MGDADVLELVRQDRLLEAARLSQSRGDARTASQLFERACDWSSAAAAALRCAEPERALDLALHAGDETLAEDAARQVAADPARAAAAAEQLARRGQDRWAARVFEGAGRSLDAARAWERAGDAIRSAALFERACEPAQAARVLEGVLRRDPPAADAPRAAVALGLLLVRFAKDEAAVRALQRVPASAPERREALVPMIAALARLGLARAAHEATSELAALGAIEATAGTPGTPQPVGPRYEVLRQVASSPRAQVLECLDRARGERVAIKRFAAAPHEDDAGTDGPVARFVAESRALAALHHPAIVAVRDVLPEVPAIVLGWMGGGSLDGLLARAPQGRLGPARAVEIACTVLDALAASHRLGILHRAIKPTNVLFDDDGAARVSDFGASRLADATSTMAAGDDAAAAFLGPEQRQGRDLTARSDVFAVGVLLGRMLGGAAVDGVPAPSAAHRGLDARHDAAVARLRAADPLARPADALEAQVLLRSLPWPSDVDLHAPDGEAPLPPDAPASIPDPGAERLEAGPDGRIVDTWTGRAVELVPLTDATLARARTFAAAGHVAVQAVLRVDRAARVIWLAAAAAVLERAPTASEGRRIDAALRALRMASGDATAPPDDAARARVLVDTAGNVLVGFALPDHLSSTIA